MNALTSIVIRSFNEAWALASTLDALKGQDFPAYEVIVIDSGSTDGSVKLIEDFGPTHFVRIRPEEYNPSRVMNQGMRLAQCDTVIFLNADATPQGPRWLAPLYEALQDSRTAAVFSRQIPRQDCREVFKRDYEVCFGDQRRSAHWDHFFSMVSSGIRRDVWELRGFREDLQYAEDDEYTRWCRKEGYHVRYVPESLAMHSHNYTFSQAYGRAFGDARAMAATYSGPIERLSWWRTFLMGLGKDAASDLTWCARQGRLREWPHAAQIRWAQRWGKWRGFHQGWNDYRLGSNAS